MHSYEFKTTSEQQLFPIVSAKTTVKANPADATIADADFPKNNTNTGATGTITLTLPLAKNVKGKSMHVQLTAYQIVRLDPNGTEKIYLGGDGVAGKYLNIAAILGNYVDVFSDGTDFLVTGYFGVVTKEA